MRTTCWLFAALWLAGMSSAHAQRRFRIGPTYSSLGLDDGSGASHSFSAWGGSAALITGDDGETGLTIARYHDLSTDKGIRRCAQRRVPRRNRRASGQRADPDLGRAAGACAVRRRAVPA